MLIEHGEITLGNFLDSHTHSDGHGSFGTRVGCRERVFVGESAGPGAGVGRGIGAMGTKHSCLLSGFALLRVLFSHQCSPPLLAALPSAPIACSPVDKEKASSCR